jgi:hypothetical protein
MEIVILSLDPQPEITRADREHCEAVANICVLAVWKPSSAKRYQSYP